MDLKTYSELEIEFYDKFNKGNNTIDLLLKNSSLTEATLNIVIEKLTSNNTIKFNKLSRSYEYCEKLNKDKMIVLDGHVMLPVSVIKHDGKTYVIRGNWYEFDGDIDIKNIIWNVELPDKNNKNIELRELVQNQLMTHKRAKIVQLEQYNNLRNIIVPYNGNLVLKLLTIGLDQTDAELIFNYPILDENSGLISQSRKMKLKTVISTHELIAELSKTDHDKRDYESIKINKIYNLTDFIVKGNCFPIEITKTWIKYLELSQSKTDIVLTEFVQTFDSYTPTGKTYEFTIGDGFDFIRELFNTKINKFIEDSGLYIDN